MASNDSESIKTPFKEGEASVSFSLKGQLTYSGKISVSSEGTNSWIIADGKYKNLTKQNLFYSVFFVFISSDGEEILGSLQNSNAPVFPLPPEAEINGSSRVMVPTDVIPRIATVKVRAYLIGHTPSK
jgi:hypothetical protein